MCNCGNKRNEYRNEENFISVNNMEEQQPATGKQIQQDAYFEYTGKTGLTIKGNITGKIYRFAFSSDRQLIDQRDTFAMMAVPVLKKVKQTVSN
jgi:hypothetical protein